MNKGCCLNEFLFIFSYCSPYQSLAWFHDFVLSRPFLSPGLQQAPGAILMLNSSVGMVGGVVLAKLCVISVPIDSA